MQKWFFFDLQHNLSLKGFANQKHNFARYWVKTAGCFTVFSSSSLNFYYELKKENCLLDWIVKILGVYLNLNWFGI